MKKQSSIIIVLLVIFSLAISACGNQATATPVPSSVEVLSSNDIVAEGRLEPVQGTNLSFSARGVVEAVLVKAGDAVSEGDVLVRLANAGGVEAQIVVAQNAYDTLLRTEGGNRASLWQAYMAAQIARASAEKKWEALDVNNIEDRIEDDKATVEDRQQDLTDAQDEGRINLL